MGRCNNRRAQERAAQMQNTPSRARFSKGPPQKNKGRGRGRGGRGRGDASAAVEKTKTSVITKIAQRVENLKTPTVLSTSTRKKHPLEGIDMLKLDEVTLSTQSIEMVTKLLRDLRVMEPNDRNYRSEKDDDDMLEDLCEDMTNPAKSSGGYTEYEDDVDFDGGYVPATFEDESDDEPDEDVDELSTLDDTLRESPLFQHLTVKFSFSAEHATRACRGIENWGLSTELKEASALNSEKLALAMDWLCLHLTDAELKEGFKVNPDSIAKRSLSGILLVGSGRTRAIPHASISIAKPLTSDKEWRETIQRESRKVGFLRLGFSSEECEKACDQSPYFQIKRSEDDDPALRIMLSMLEREALDMVDTPSTETLTATDLDFAKEEQEHEVEAMKAIFDHSFSYLPSENGLDRCFVKIIPVQDLKSPASSASCSLHVFVRKGYPIAAAPLLLFTNSTLPPSLLRRINLILAREANQLVGEPSMFALVDSLANSVHEMQIEFIKEQRTKEIEAEQVRMRREAGHDVDDLLENEITDKKIGRRQRAKLRAAVKAFDASDQLKVKEEEKKRREETRIARVQGESKSIRYTMAERAILKREQQRIDDEVEKAARHAMNQAFLEGKSTEEARDLANRAREECLRFNGMESTNDGEKKEQQRGAGSKVVEIAASTLEAKTEDSGNETESVDDPTNEDDAYSRPKATATTTAFMERLRAYYSKAAELKSKLGDAVAAVSSKNVDGSLSDVKIVLNDPQAATNMTSVNDDGREVPVQHIPAPIPIPTGDLTNVMNDVMSVQNEQPWLISAEARVPSSRMSGVSLSKEDIQKRDDISRRLRFDLEKKYKASERVGERNPEIENSRKGGSPSAKFYRMMSQRRRLPAYIMKEKIIQTIENNQICVVSGDTGCGKTTQVPQLVLDDLIWKGRGAEANMIVTQPRRISAIGVSERVADERCERIGETAGYAIRLENKRSSKTRILLCTTGILLRRLQCDPDLASVSHVFVDEVHERDLNTDFLLIILRDLLARRKSLKLVLMSATLNADAFSAYFGGCPVVSIPGRAHPVSEHRLEDVLKLTNYEVQPHSDYALKNIEKNPPKFSKSKLRQMYYPKYPTSVINSLAIVDETVINYELLAELIEYITVNNEDGAILIFMPGMAEITKAVDELYKKEIFQSSKVEVYPLHSSLSTSEQTAVFEVPPKGVRKIVVSTNIAETSITIEDVVYVVDCGRVKENRKDELNELPTLVETWVSRASAKQRRGRAGRVRPGIAYHMYSSHTFESEMQDYQLPEMLRVGLEDLVLQILVLDLGEPSSFLAKAVNPPSALAMKNSLKQLEGLGAVEVSWSNDDSMNVKKEDTENSCGTVSADSGLTALGFHLATLPVDPRVGKMMIYGALFGCTEPALTIAASMSARSPFMSPFDQRDQADEARQTFATEGSDPLTILTAFQQWKEIRRTKGDRATNSFLRDSFLSRLTLFQMEDLRKQFANLLVEIGFLPKGFKLNNQQTSNALTMSANAHADNIALIKAVLCAGLYPNIIVAPRSLVCGRPSSQAAGECAFRGSKGEVYLHPSTISFSSKRLDSRYCCYHEIVKTSKIYVRDCTTVSPFALLLFGGSLRVYHVEGVATVDQWLRFRIARKPAALVKHLRSQMESLLLKKIVSPHEDVTGSKEGQALIQAVSALLQNEKPAALPDGAEIVRPWTGSADQEPSGRRGRGGRGRGGRNSGRNSGQGGRGHRAPSDEGQGKKVSIND